MYGQGYAGRAAVQRGAGEEAEENQEARRRLSLSGGCEDDFVYGQEEEAHGVMCVCHLPIDVSRHLSRQL